MRIVTAIKSGSSLAAAAIKRAIQSNKPLRHFGYDAVVTDTRRKPPRYDVKSEDDHLNAVQRRKLVSTTRDLRRSYSLAAWMIRKHIDYVASFSFQGKNKNEELNNHVEKLVKWWSLPQNFDVAGRHSLHRFTRLAESSRVVDGDVFLYKTNLGFIQAIEGDRIANISGAELPNRYKISDFKRGIKCSKGGRAQAYIVCNRSKKGTRLTFQKVVPAKYIIPFAYWDRFDQIRGISPLASAVNTLQDTYEGITYALARAKVSQLFALALKRGTAKPAGEVTAGDDETDDSEYRIDFGKGPIVLDLDIDDEASFLESAQPSDQLQSFMQIMIALALKALDIPYCFYAEDFTNYSGSRQALLLYEQSAKEKRLEVKDLLNALTRWRLELWVLNDILKLPKGMTVSDIAWEWQPSGIPWIDPLREVKADSVAIGTAINSRTRILKRMGSDFNEVLDELEYEEKELKKRNITQIKPAIERMP